MVLTDCRGAVRFLFPLILCMCASSFAADKPTAREYVRQIRTDANNAYKAKDYRAAREGFAEWHAFAPSSPVPVYNLACVDALLGNKTEALRWLDLYARMGQVADLSKDTDLASLADSAEFKIIVARMNKPAQTTPHSELVISLGKEALLEDLAFDPDERAYYLSSLLDKRVVKISKDKKLTVVADLSRDPGWPVFAVAVQRGTHPVLWVTVAAMPDFAASPKQDWGKTLLLKIDPDTGKILERIAPPNDADAHVLGDMAIAHDGTLVVSDGQSGGVYLLKPGTKELRRIDAGQFISPQSPAFALDGYHVFIADYSRGIARVDLQSRSIQWMKAPPDAALTGIDGFYFNGSRLVAVQNGTSPTRIVRLLLSPDLSLITKLETIADGADAEDVNHGAFNGSSFYYITHAGWDALDAKGNRKQDAKTTAPELRRIDVRAGKLGRKR